MSNNLNEYLLAACKNGDVDSAISAIERGATDLNRGLAGACFGGQVELANMMIVRGATDWNWGLCGACLGGQVELANMMIVRGATDWNEGLRNACYYGYIELAKLMIAYGATDWDAVRYCHQSIKEYIKAQWKLHDARSAPIIRMLRRFIVRMRNAKRIQRWWRGTYPLWRELAYAPPNGLRYRQSFEHFKKISNDLNYIENLNI